MGLAPPEVSYSPYPSYSSGCSSSKTLSSQIHASDMFMLRFVARSRKESSVKYDLVQSPIYGQILISERGKKRTDQNRQQRGCRYQHRREKFREGIDQTSNWVQVISVSCIYDNECGCFSKLDSALSLFLSCKILPKVSHWMRNTAKK